MGATTTTKIYVVEKLLKEGAGFWAYYDQKDLGGKLYIDLAKGESFDPSAVTLEGKNADGSYFEYATTITVTKDGEVVTDYSEPGTYSVRVDIDVPRTTLSTLAPRPLTSSCSVGATAPSRTPGPPSAARTPRTPMSSTTGKGRDARRHREGRLRHPHRGRGLHGRLQGRRRARS